MRKALEGMENAVMPIMQSTARDLHDRLSQVSTNNLELQRILMRDPAATIALYRRLEKSRPGTAIDIAAPAHALSLVGYDAFTEMLDTLPQIEPPAPEKRQTSVVGAYSQAAHAAWYARDLCSAVSIGGAEETALAALLQNPALIALWHKDPTSATRATNVVLDGVPFDMAFSAELGEPLSIANQRLAAAWHFPKLARDVMGDWDPFSRQAQVVRLADLMSQVSEAGWPRADTELQAEILEEFLGISHQAAQNWWRQSACEAARNLNDTGYPLPAFQLALISTEEEPEPDPEPEPKPEQQAPPNKGPEPQQVAPTQDLPPETAEQSPPDREAIDQQPDQPVVKQATGQTPPTDLHGILSDIMRRMQLEAGTTRVVFAMLNRERTELRTRLALGCDRQAPIRVMRLDPRQRHLFGLLVGKQQSIWINPDNRLKYAPYLKQIPQDQASGAGFFAMSLFVRSKPLGLLYGDGGQLSKPGYQRFRQLCSEVVQLLEGNSGAPSAAPIE